MAKYESVFRYDDADLIEQTIARYVAAALALQPLFLTRAEFIEAFMVPEHVAKCEEVAELINGSNSSSLGAISLSTDAVDTSKRTIAATNWIKPSRLLIPNYVRDRHYNVDTPAGKKVLEWAKERHRMGVLGADAIEAMHFFNSNCGNVKAMHLCFPALSSILVRAEGGAYKHTKDGEGPLAKRGRKIDSSNVIGTMPSLPREVIDRCREAAAFVQACLLLEDTTIQTPEYADVAIVAWRSDPRVNNPDYVRRPSMFYAGQTTNNLI